MLTDADILFRLTNVEDATVERKPTSDIRDCVKAAVALSNSLALGEPGIIYFGVYDDGQTPLKTPLNLYKKS
jgi:predicted HTH transcriptional regulator